MEEESMAAFAGHILVTVHSVSMDAVEFFG